MSNQTTRAGGTVHDLLEAVDRIRSVIEEHADSAETNRQLSAVVYDAMYQAGLFAMLAPKAHGGLELHPVEAMRVWEAVARSIQQRHESRDEPGHFGLRRLVASRRCARGLPSWTGHNGRRVQSSGYCVESGWWMADHWAGSLRQRMPPSAMAVHASRGNGWRPSAA